MRPSGTCAKRKAATWWAGRPVMFSPSNSTAPEIAGLRFFVHGRGHALRRDGARRAPPGLAIARVGIEEAAFVRLFGAAGPRGVAARGVIEAVAGGPAAAAIAAGLRSDVEVLTAAGWRRATDLAGLRVGRRSTS
jgi:hypothetical protein